MRKMEWNGKQVNAQPLEFEAVAPEKFTYYKASDGTTLKVKVVLTEVCRVEGEFHAGTGEPVYITSQMVMVITEAKSDRMQDMKEGKYPIKDLSKD